MENTTSGTFETHQEVYEWWRSKKEELVESISHLRSSGTLDSEILDLMEGIAKNVKVRKKTMDEYFEEIV